MRAFALIAVAVALGMVGCCHQRCRGPVCESVAGGGAGQPAVAGPAGYQYSRLHPVPTRPVFSPEPPATAIMPTSAMQPAEPPPVSKLNRGQQPLQPPPAPLPGVEPGLGGGKPAKPASLSRTRVADENRERSWVFLPAVAPESPAPRQTNAWDIDPDKARQQAPPR